MAAAGGADRAMLAEANGPVAADLALVPAVDCTGPVDDGIFRLQMMGIAACR